MATGVASEEGLRRAESLHPLHGAVDGVAHIHLETSWLAKKSFVAGRASAEAAAGGVVLGIHLCFHNHAPEHAAILLEFNQQATDEV